MRACVCPPCHDVAIPVIICVFVPSHVRACNVTPPPPNSPNVVLLNLFSPATYMGGCATASKILRFLENTSGVVRKTYCWSLGDGQGTSASSFPSWALQATPLLQCIFKGRWY